MNSIKLVFLNNFDSFFSPLKSSLLFENDFIYKANFFDFFLSSNNNILKNGSFFSVRSALLAIKLWNIKIRFYVTARILRAFNFIHKIRLKNIFFKFFKDFPFWKEIQKMFDSNLVNISDNSIYNSKKNLGNSLLSSFLFNLYVLDMDNYLEKFVFRFSIKKYLYNVFNISKQMNFFYFYILRYFVPIKSEKILFFFANLKNLISLKYKKLNTYFSLVTKRLMFYERIISYCRYLDFVIFGCITSKFYVYYLKSKFLNFLHHKLYFKVKDLRIFNHKENNIIFLGFNITFRSVLSIFSRLRINKKYFLKVFNRILLEQNKLSRILQTRFNYLFHFNIIHFFKNPSFTSFSFKRHFWNLIFQSESLRSIKLCNLVLINDEKQFFSNRIFNSLKYLKLDQYKKYNFCFYNLKLQILLRRILLSFSGFFLSSNLSIDFILHNYLLEFKRNILLLYHQYTPLFSFYNDFEKNLNKINYFSNFKNDSYFYVKYILFLQLKRNLFSANNFSKEFLTFFVPTNFLLKKLRFLSFLHPFKNRPISNPHLIFFEDSYIIKSYGYLAYSILIWFSLCKNFSYLLFLIELLRESCFLTLSRKHNKSKIWAYSVYTFDLLLFRNLYFTKSFFPTRNFLLNLNKKNILYYLDFGLDESFFLEY